MLELMSVMEPLYPKGIGWKLWKEKTPKDILKSWKLLVQTYYTFSV